MTSVTLIALKMALPSATGWHLWVGSLSRRPPVSPVNQETFPHAHLGVGPQFSFSHMVPWGLSVLSERLETMSGQYKMKVRLERKTTAEKRKVGRQVLKHLDMFLPVSKFCRSEKKRALCLWLCRFIGIVKACIEHWYTWMIHRSNLWLWLCYRGKQLLVSFLCRNNQGFLSLTPTCSEWIIWDDQLSLYVCLA